MNSINKIDFLKNKLEKFPDSPLEVELAGYLLESGNVLMAIKHCVNGLINYPDYLTAYLLLAKCFITNNEFHHAYITLQKADRVFPLQKPVKAYFEALEHFKNTYNADLDFLDNLESIKSKRYSEKSSKSFSTFEEILKDHRKTPQNAPSIEDEHLIDKAIKKIEEKKSSLDLSLLGDEFLTIDDFEISKNNSKKYKVLEVNELGGITDRGEKSRVDESISKKEIVREIISLEDKQISDEKFEFSNEDNLSVKTSQIDELESPDQDFLLQIEENTLSQNNDKILAETSGKKYDLQEEITKLNEIENIIGTENAKEGSTELKIDESDLKQDLPIHFVNRTLANIYESQGKYSEAIDVYNQLFLNESISQDEFNLKITELQSKLSVQPDLDTELEI